MMEALTGDNRLTEQAIQLLKKEREGEQIMMSDYINMLEARGAARGEAALATLLKKLYDLGRDTDAKLAVQDTDIRTKLYKEFHIQNI